MKTKTITLILILFLLAGLSACSAFESDSQSDGLTASGFIATDHIRVAPEISGKVLTIEVAEGDRVQAGDVLFSMDDELLQAQAEQAQAAVDLATVSVTAANAQLSSAQVQYDLVVQQARLAHPAATAPRPGRLLRRACSNSLAGIMRRANCWRLHRLRSILPARILDTELANLAVELEDASNEDFVALEKRAGEARFTYQIAEQTLKQAQTASSVRRWNQKPRSNWMQPRLSWMTVQMEYERMLSSDAAQSVLEARASVAVARARLDIALDTLAGLQTGEDSLQVKAALSAVSQAETAVSQAEANLAQAQAALNLIDLQLEKSVVTAPSAGTVLALNVEAGELVSAGSVVLTLGQLDELNLTVYVPEDEYGQIRLGQEVSIAVDSYPDQVFNGQVMRYC